MQHGVLKNFFKSMLDPRDREASPGSPVLTPAAAAGKPAATGPRTSIDRADGGGASAS